ncbi:Protein sym1 [Madurella mycetomatis]|uniref:Protein sym1 n=1 Tax=Madurella mycetomatis TaxID=100816 RepID=A0A175W605_9PEZI|nr:Protein sym1 [Madurella mycetomatis]
MTWELNRRRWLRIINSKFIYGRIVSSIACYLWAVSATWSRLPLLPTFHHPLLHAIIFFIEMALLARLTSRFNSYYDERPLLTMMVTNSILGGVADTVAQSITSIRQRALRKHPNGHLSPRQDPVAIEIHELDRKNPFSDRELIPESKALPPPFDFERLTRFMAYGFCIAPVQFRWFKFLERCFPITKASAFMPAMKRVAFDQLIFAPFGVAAFFTAMTVAEGGGRRAVSHKLRDMYVPTLKANYMLWPAVQVINFRLMPVQFQLPFVSTVGIAWTAYLSLTNAAGELEQNRIPSASDIRLP